MSPTCFICMGENIYCPKHNGLNSRRNNNDIIKCFEYNDRNMKQHNFNVNIDHYDKKIEQIDTIHNVYDTTRNGKCKEIRKNLTKTTATIEPTIRTGVTTERNSDNNQNITTPSIRKWEGREVYCTPCMNNGRGVIFLWTNTSTRTYAPLFHTPGGIYNTKRQETTFN